MSADKQGQAESLTGSAETPPGPKHKQEREVVWARWQKKRVFVRALEGTYSHLTKELLNRPRIYSEGDVGWKGRSAGIRQTYHQPGCY